MWIAYFATIALAVGTVAASVVRHLRGPHRPPATAALPTRAATRVCVEELAALHREQNQRAWRLGGEIGAGGALAAFDAWSRDWERRVEDLGDRCRVDVSEPDGPDRAGRAELARARDAVLALHRAYRAQVNRFALEQAELADAATAALGAAQRAATAARR
jgi:hypothetical protein